MAHPTSDHRGRQLKELASEVKKLRGWAASDESVAERLTDALNELTAQRLLGHQYVAAVEDAPMASLYGLAPRSIPTVRTTAEEQARKVVRLSRPKGKAGQRKKARR